jgi:hypothetical protein
VDWLDIQNPGQRSDPQRPGGVFVIACMIVGVVVGIAIGVAVLCILAMLNFMFLHEITAISMRGSVVVGALALVLATMASIGMSGGDEDAAFWGIPFIMVPLDMLLAFGWVLLFGAAQ